MTTQETKLPAFKSSASVKRHHPPGLRRLQRDRRRQQQQQQAAASSSIGNGNGNEQEQEQEQERSRSRHHSQLVTVWHNLENGIRRH